MSALIQTALVAYDFSWVKCGATPGRGFCGVTVEAATSKVLSLL